MSRPVVTLFIICLVLVSVVFALPGDDLKSIKPLRRWLKKNGGFVGKIDVQYFSDQGRGLVATEDIQEGETLFKIPFSLMMKGSDLADSGIASEFEHESDVYKMAAFVLLQKSTSTTKWKEFIDTFPEEIDTPLSWTDEEIEQLQLLSLTEIVEGRLADLKEAFDLMFRQPVSQPELLGWMNQVSFDEFKWAVSVVWSRSFAITEKMGQALVPLADLMNMETPKLGRPNPMVSVEVTDTHLVYTAARDIYEFEQIFAQYGQRGPASNAALLMDYGFVFPDNPFDSASLKLPMNPEDNLFETKRTVMRNVGCYRPIGYPVLHGVGPSELFCAARVLTMTKKELDNPHYRKLVKEGKPLDTENEKAALKLIEDAATELLGSAKTTEDEDAKILSYETKPRVQRAIIVRARQKQVLAWLAQFASRLRRAKRTLDLSKPYLDPEVYITNETPNRPKSSQKDEL